ncbi:MAG: cytosine permease [Microbacteriaceae bacterium]|jgi:purine-cytosine permease-like protein|nr:cytosine permease [Microbacteriaceae bacterium]
MESSTTHLSEGNDRSDRIERNGLNEIAEEEHHGTPAQLFWPWFAANISVLGISYGAFLLGFAISFWQATIVGLVGIVISFLLCGFVALAGKRGHAPTMTLSRAVFGVNGNRLPSLISWMLTVGWETVLVVLAVLATSTVFGRLGWVHGTVAQVIAMVVVIALVVLGGLLGFDFIMKLQQWITIITAVLTVIYMALVLGHINVSAIASLKGGSLPTLIGAFVFMMTGFGLGWVNAAADYSRYLPRKASNTGVVFWTTFGAALPPIILLVFGLLLAGSSTKLSTATANDPIGALTTILPVWYLVPFAFVTVLGLVGGAVLDIYSSGFSLLSVGLRVPRWSAALVDGVIMTLGAIYVVFFSDSFFVAFQGFLITLGVPIAVWCGLFLGDLLLRRAPYDGHDLLDARGRYGSVNWWAILVIVVGTVVGWGLVVNTYAGWLKWQGFLLGPLGLGGRTGAWGGANLGVLVALVLGFAGGLLQVRRVRAQESRPVTTTVVDEEA